jgi:hypothetical protein
MREINILKTMPIQPERKHVSYLFSIIFFISGASALIFESIWFHQAGLNLGNSVWASSIVLASFMAGLAIGSAIIAIIGDKIHFPLRFYAGTNYSQLYILHLCLHDPDLKAYIPWALNSDYYAIEIVKDILKTKPEIELGPTAIKQHLVAIAAMSGNYLLAEQILASNTKQSTQNSSWQEIALRIYFLILSGKMEKVEQISRQYVANSTDPVKTQEGISEIVNWSEKAISTARKFHKDE